MRLADLTQHAGEWLRGEGPMYDVVISSRVRLARNLAGMPFLGKCTESQQQEIEQRLRAEVLAGPAAPEMFYVDVRAAGELDRKLLVERHLISRQHAEASHPRGVAVSGDETVALMINEEDHLRMQVLRTGFQLAQAFEDISRIDDSLEQRLDFAFHSRYGYLTACPTNVGTGLRVSVMLHLPALKMTGQIEKLFHAASDMHLEVRGLYGEGTEATGDFFQISNQTTLGKSERQIVSEFVDTMVPSFVQYERLAREALLAERPAAIDDKVARSVALLRSARLMSSDETMYLLSLVRLGANLRRIEGMDLKTINELFLLTQPAHLQRILNREMTPDQRAAARADYLRRKLNLN
ncbi:MAG TPA: protein arginine kinase [Phycisphaerales bacterium]|nr:protein arginine kinase [Phycisphaerales bacterium]